MTRSCSALGCTARDTGRSRERGISFHQFPVDAAQRREWIRAVNRVDPRSRQAWKPGPGAILCSRHFAETDFERYGLRRKLRRGAVPSRFPQPEPPGPGRGSGAPARALKQPVPSQPAGVTAGDHNYSLHGQREAGSPRGTPEQQLPPAPAACPAHPGLAGVLRELVEKQRIAEETVCLLRAQFADLPCDLHSWRQMSEYSPEMRQFACILHLYHIKAYDYLRKIFPLPHPYSLTTQVFVHSLIHSECTSRNSCTRALVFLPLPHKDSGALVFLPLTYKDSGALVFLPLPHKDSGSWLSNNEATAGFSNAIFLRLQEKVERGEEAYWSCALMIQDMSLEKQQQWDPQTKCLTGYVNLGAGVLDADEAPLASEAIIIMAVGISSPWTAPLGYFLVNRTTGHFLAQLLRQTINKLNHVGIKVLAVTSGATAQGAETARALGIRIDPRRIQCTFQHPPGSAHSITYFFDTCHALQLVKNALQCFQKIKWLSDMVRWQHVVELAALQEQRVLKPPSPQSGRPVSEETYHLKINLATQLFSEGVADALEHLQELGLASFQDCKGTVKFVRLMSRLCDMFHGRGRYRRGLREPLLAGNHTKINRLFNEAKRCFTTLTDSMGRCIIKSKRKLGFFSFLLNAKSLKWLYTNHLSPEGTRSPHLLTCSFSLDPLELFLRALQEACGSSRSPTCTAFQAAYHKLLASYSLLPGSPHSHGSSLDLSLSRRRDLTLGSVRAQHLPAGGRTGGAECPCCAGFPWRSSALSEALTDMSLSARGMAWAAGLVAEQLASALPCQACLASLFQADESRPRCGSVLYIKKSGGVSLPSASVYHLTSVSEKVLNWYRKVGDSNKKPKLWHLYLAQEVCQELLGESPLFPTLTDHLLDGELCVNNHYTVLVKEITQRYLNIRTNPAKHLNLKHHCGKHRWKRLKGKTMVSVTTG
ncbi:DNA transposase THAP9 [Apus apus]|uniref:DNA transposase THAP9 n=1 Tax=Apus apus TaxID=8895 RepID=UPI0021F8E16A|nr:DNA transposase THAP9 [Apus apus]